MKLLILFFSLSLFVTSNTQIDYSILEEESVYIRLDKSEKLTKIIGKKSFFIAGESFPGYNSKLSVKGTETALKIKKGTEMVFYVRGSSTIHKLPFSIVKMDVTKKKRIASSKEGMTSDKDKLITYVPFKSVELDKGKNISRITLNQELSTGVWCASFRRVGKGKFLMGTSYGKYAFCFEIIE